MPKCSRLDERELTVDEAGGCGQSCSWSGREGAGGKRFAHALLGKPLHSMMF